MTVEYGSTADIHIYAYTTLQHLAFVHWEHISKTGKVK